VGGNDPRSSTAQSEATRLPKVAAVHDAHTHTPSCAHAARGDRDSGGDGDGDRRTTKDDQDETMLRSTSRRQTGSTDRQGRRRRHGRHGDTGAGPEHEPVLGGDKETTRETTETGHDTTRHDGDETETVVQAAGEMAGKMTGHGLPMGLGRRPR
jgi:hypothetical protein